jgi:nicotinate-nucleotide adenylyltransferase
MSSTAAPSEAPLGILGGTFDPIHTAHLRLAEVACDLFRLAGVIFVPTGQPWHRAHPVAGGEDRLAMVRIATAGDSRFSVDAGEVLGSAPGYTVETLERLRGQYGRERALVLLLGADAFLGLPSWHRWRDIFGLAHLGVASRPGHPLDPGAMAPDLADEFGRRCGSSASLAAAPAGAIVPFALSAGTVSATEARQRLAAGAGVGDLLPGGVVDYIAQRNLYPD